jgi:thioredoxin 2
VNAPAGSLVVRCSACGARNRFSAARAAEGPVCGRCKAPLRAGEAVSAAPVVATDRTFAAEVEGTRGAVLVDFWAPWCGPCRAVAPMLEELARERAGRLKIVKVNVDENPGLSRRFGIQAIPTLAVFRDGAQIDQIRGAVPKPTLVAQLARHGIT